MNRNQFTVILVLVLCVSISDVHAFGAVMRRNMKKIAKEVQNTSVNETEFFENSFPRPEELKSIEKQTGSLWVDSYSSNLYKNLHRASRVGDMVTIMIEENATGTDIAQTRAERSADTTLNLGGLFGVLSRLTSAISGLDPSKTIDVQSDNNFEGRGQTTRKGTLNASLTARVIQVLKNGDLLIRGKKNIKINGEDRALIVEGFIRPYDITANNVVMSTHIADARITFSGFGPVSDKQKPGWFARILDHILPF